MRRPGDIVSIPVSRLKDGQGELLRPELAEVSVRIKHIGPRMARDWQFALQRVRVAERARLRDIPEDELLRDDDGEPRAFQTVDGLEDLAKFARDVAASAVVGIDGLGYEVEDPADELDRIDLCTLLLDEIMNAQGLKESEVF